MEYAIAGIDVGSVSVSVAVIDDHKNLLHKASAFHHGNVRHCLSVLLSHETVTRAAYVAVTDATPEFVFCHDRFDEQVAIIRAARAFHKIGFDTLLHVGGEKFSLSLFDAQGNYTGARHNTSCAAGTGSFLDQQARRLNLKGSNEISENALKNRQQRPDIATRCAVFAKTDLIHAQQEGYNIEQICDGLCHGLAKNIANTLFKGCTLSGKIIFCGGVSKNIAVTRYLESILDTGLTIDDCSQVYGAAGAAFCLWDRLQKKSMTRRSFDSPQAFFKDTYRKDSYLYPALSLTLSDYPEFSCYRQFVHDGVEVEIYTDPARVDLSSTFLGLDVGSTSTKSILINQDKVPVMGCYTKTASRPVQAVQIIFEAMDRFMAGHNLQVVVKGCGTTGSGRRISGRIIGADIEPDEITAHATAAVNLNKDVDTIIEIGGQDAKFTLLRDGRVTASVMNTVCAAGTGSFIEEQAQKLSCPLSEYSEKAEGVNAPVSSDRCTVFMERDINFFLAEGYEKNEILASVLHSVRDNYLTKVATVGRIGNCILFQGATARNRALVAAFEQKLQKPIHVSQFCHLTGALGVALLAREEQIPKTQFRGFDLWQKKIPVHQEVCQLCTNHCKLTIAHVDGRPQAYGFLCGRDYDTQKMVPVKNRYNLTKLRKKNLRPMETPPQTDGPTLGIPAALHLFEDLEFWELFFSLVGIKTIVSRNLKQPVTLGKTLAKAEFCAPVMALHGHVAHLLKKADYLFLPFYFEDRPDQKRIRRQHCYYTQFTPSVIACLDKCDENRLVMPTIKYLYTGLHTKMALYRALKQISPDRTVSFFDIHTAWEKALEFRKQNQASLSSLFQAQAGPGVRVLLLGRPYTVLPDTMNHHIPQIFEKMGVQTFFQDMLDTTGIDFTPIQPLLSEIHWKYAARILEAAWAAAMTDGIYPVYITSFKCSPDAFGVTYFKQIMERSNKPYLVLELDEHDSSVGYETRIEAAVRAFNNHHQAKGAPADLPLDFSPRYFDRPADKNIIFPNWDTLTGQLIVSTFQNEGVSAYLMEETTETLKKSLLTNTGQCIPLNAVAAGFIHTVKKHNLDPEKTLLWLNRSDIACNIRMYPYHIQQIFRQEGSGFEKSGIYLGELSLFDISFKASTNAYFAYMFGGLLRSIGCKIRPYEINKGETDRTLSRALVIISRAFAKGTSKQEALARAIPLFSKIKTRGTGTRPKVAIFGDLYVRDNEVMNQNLIHYIEANGGEVVTTPYYKYIKIIANSYFKKWFKEGKYLSLISNKALQVATQAMEKKYFPYFEPVLQETDFMVSHPSENVLEQYGIQPEHTGESMDNILKIHHVLQEHPDLALLVQTTPAFCCPGLVTEAMAARLEAKTGVPIVSITYDVSGGNKNKVIVPFIKYFRPKTHLLGRKISG
ncbi:MAG: acyl-CoA dehydratase activase [Desulfotignum sp.]|nr:acyl-CoA dehydratase activase [Desulfotignum sp.]